MLRARNHSKHYKLDGVGVSYLTILRREVETNSEITISFTDDNLGQICEAEKVTDTASSSMAPRKKAIY